MSFFNNLFPSFPSPSYEELSQGTLLDVRTTEEFQNGCHPLSLNIPMDQVPASLDKIKALKQPLYVCCKSGGRSGQIQQWLAGQGVESINVGGWEGVAKH